MWYGIPPYLHWQGDATQVWFVHLRWLQEGRGTLVPFRGSSSYYIPSSHETSSHGTMSDRTQGITLPWHYQRREQVKHGISWVRLRPLLWFVAMWHVVGGLAWRGATPRTHATPAYKKSSSEKNLTKSSCSSRSDAIQQSK